MTTGRLAVLAAAAAAALGGCGGSDAKEPTGPGAAARVVQGTLDLERSQAGPPDAGTQGGHGADRYIATAAGPNATITGTVRPASARIAIVDGAGERAARVSVTEGGRFRAVLPGLRRGSPVVFTLTATAPGAEPWRTEIVASRSGRAAASAGRELAVPARDLTPPFAFLVLRNGSRRVSSVSPVRRDDDAPLRLTRPELRLLAVIRDEDGGTGRIRASLTYVRSCPGGEQHVPTVTRRALHFPPSEIGRVLLPPGADAPAERRRDATVRLERGTPGCTVRGEAWADATNASGLESFSDQIRFELAPGRG